ncbi:MAG: hypothetical protein ABL967_08870 [Bryobacteraceae bacterium]
MDFQATPLNMTTLLVVTLAVVTLVLLFRGRWDSNLPLLFYSATFILVTTSDRSLNPYLFYSGIVLALILRFEFMGKGFTKFIGFLNISAIGLATIAFLDQIFGDGTLLSS